MFWGSYMVVGVLGDYLFSGGLGRAVLGFAFLLDFDVVWWVFLVVRVSWWVNFLWIGVNGLVVRGLWILV